MTDLHDKEITRLLQVHEPSQSIFREGDPGSVMYVVQDGEVEICKHQNGQTVGLRVIRKGEFFGEMALVDNSPRSASAFAGPNGARVLAIDSANFVYLVSQQPAFALVVLQTVVTRLRSQVSNTKEN